MVTASNLYETFSVVSAKATQLIFGDTDNPVTGLIVNNDLTHPITIGDFGLNVGDTNSSIVQPLQAIAYDGKTDIYARTATGQTAQVMVMPGISYWAPSPAQAAAQIAALGLALETTQQTNTAHTLTTANNVATVNGSVNTVNATLGAPAQDPTVGGLATSIPTNISTTGVPLLTGASVASSGSGTIANGATLAPPAFTIAGIGYEFVLTLQIGAGANLPFVQVLFTWTDIASGLTVGIEEWWLAAASGPAQQYIGRGPSKGDRLAITIKNFDPTLNMTYSYTVLANSRVYLRDEWRQTTYNAVPSGSGVTQGNSDPNSNMLLNTAPAVGATVMAQRIMPLYSGLVSVNVQTGGQPATFSIVALAAQVSAVNVWSDSMPASSQEVVTVALPRSVCVAQILNTGNASTNFVVDIVAQELTV